MQTPPFSSPSSGVEMVFVTLTFLKFLISGCAVFRTSTKMKDKSAFVIIQKFEIICKSDC